MNYLIISYRYYVLGETSLNYWGNRCQIPREPRPRYTGTDIYSKLQASLVGEKSFGES